MKKTSYTIDPHPHINDVVLPLVLRQKGKSLAYSDKQYFKLKKLLNNNI